MSDGWEEHSPSTRGLNLAALLVVHTLVGLPLVSWLAGSVSDSNLVLGGVWFACGVVLLLGGAVRAARRRDSFSAAWGAAAGSWLLGAFGPLGLLYAAYFWRRPEPATAVEEEPVNPELSRRLELAEQRLTELTRELAEIRRLAEGAPAPFAPSAPPVVAAPPPPPPPPPLRREPEPLPKAPAPAETGPSLWDRRIDWGDLLGAMGLAWAGGIVTVLGVVFFFVLAVNRGWIGPAERVGLGALASLLIFASGLWLHRRFGPTYSAYGAVGAGLAGGYATLVAAAALYGLVSDLGALAIAGGIGAVGLATSLAWRSELVAGIGLVGATLIPMMVLFEEDLSPIGTAFAGIVFAATAVVAVRYRWSWLLGAGVAASLPQIAILVGGGAVTDWDRVILAAVFTGLYAGAAAAFDVTSEDEGLPSLSATLVLIAGVLAGASCAALFAGDDRGSTMLVAAGGFGALAAALFPRRDLSALLGAVALALAAVGLGVVLTGPSLAIAWAAEAAVLAWLARRIAEPRYAIASLAYLGAAAVDALVEAPMDNLYEATADPAGAALGPLAVALAAGVVAWYSRPWEEIGSKSGFFSFVEPLLEDFRDGHALWRGAAGWLGGIAALYTASLASLGLVQWLGDASVEVGFERGHVLVIWLWGFAALALVAVGHRIQSAHLTAGGLLLAGATFAQAAFFVPSALEGNRMAAALLVAAAALLATAFAEEFPLPEDGAMSIYAALFALGSVALATGGLLQLVRDSEAWIDPQGAVLLALAVVYAALSAAVFGRDRDFSTVLWAPALLLGMVAAYELVSGTWLVLAWSAVAAGLAYLRVAVDEERLAVGSAAYLALALGNALGLKAPPDEFFTANSDPAVGVPSVAIATAAALVFAHFVGRERAIAVRPWFWAGTSVLGIYAASLTILGVFQWLGTASVETDFQRGHSAVSAFWGIVGLLVLYTGLTRDLRGLRAAGFALFGLALAKLFLYDLAYLSSITRALSFLAVGAVLLLAGFFYQRLAAEPRQA